MTVYHPQLRADGASRGHVSGIPPLDCGAAEPRQAYGGAAFSEFGARNQRIAEAHAAGVPMRQIGRRHNLSAARVCRIIQAQVDPVEPKRFTGKAADLRADLMVEDYEAGFTIAEVAARHRLTARYALVVLSRHPAYRNRRMYRACRERIDGVAVPAWVPAHHVNRYRHIAACNGEEIAARCLRKMKALEARA